MSSNPPAGTLTNSQSVKLVDLYSKTYPLSSAERAEGQGRCRNLCRRGSGRSTGAL